MQESMKSMVSDKKLTNAVGGKSARACDNCIKRRARWYCASDDAFLCQSCDSSVHSANSLARRHERVRLKTTPFIPPFDDVVPSWHNGITRKARTPRRQKKKNNRKSPESGTLPLHIVPEIGSDDYSENDEQLLYRVPIFDPFVEELCNSGNSIRPGGDNAGGSTVLGFEAKTASYLQGFLPSEMELAEFAADVESLLGKGLEDESFNMEGLGILDDEDNKGIDCSNSFRVKIEEDDMLQGNHPIEFESFELNFDYSPEEEEEEEDCKTAIAPEDHLHQTTKRFLRLDYDGVISSWGDLKSPWTTGERPEFNSIDYWLTTMGTTGGMQPWGDILTAPNAHGPAMDGDREARVSRYREKRRTRLFAKKIRYEVRKLNAEKRPRMKGRFVKRASAAGSSFSNLK